MWPALLVRPSRDAGEGGGFNSRAGLQQFNQESAMPSPIMKYFTFAHLPEKLQQVSKPIGELAQSMDDTLPDGPEKSAGLRKLLEAKDCLVRALV